MKSLEYRRKCSQSLWFYYRIPSLPLTSNILVWALETMCRSTTTFTSDTTTNREKRKMENNHTQ